MHSHFIQIGNLLNSEGPLLTVNSTDQGVLIIEAKSNTFNGDLSFEPKFSDLIKYIESKLTLRELIFLSKSLMFSFNPKVEIVKIPLEDIIDSLPFIDQLFSEVPENLK